MALHKCVPKFFNLHAYNHAELLIYMCGHMETWKQNYIFTAYKILPAFQN